MVLERELSKSFENENRTMADIDSLLTRTSRTFALAIPLLEEPTRREVGLSYLLFRVADTLEDAHLWSPWKRVQALQDFSDLVAIKNQTAARQRARELASAWIETDPIGHAGYLELLEELPGVLDQFFALSPKARSVIVDHTQRTANGMGAFVDHHDENGHLVLDSVDQLREYCYVVAGIVGEVLTELFVIAQPSLLSIADDLRERAPIFGQGLQLVNILKDSSDDAAVGRTYLPPNTDRNAILSLAQASLDDAAAEYVLALQEAGGARGAVAFTALPLLLAWASLDRVAEAGAGAKITRDEVYTIAAELEQRLDNDQPAVIRPSLRASS